MAGGLMVLFMHVARKPPQFFGRHVQNETEMPAGKTTGSLQGT